MVELADERLASVLALARRAATAYGRPDLDATVEEAQLRLGALSVTVFVMGAFKHGKSTLLNALVGRHVCPTDEGVATAVPIRVGWATDRRAEIIAVAAEGGADGAPAVRRVPIDPDRLPMWTTDGAEPPPGVLAPGEQVCAADVRVDSPLLAAGLVLVDTPGAGGLRGLRGAATMAMLPSADAVLFVTDAAAELTAAELGLLQEIAGRCPRLAVVETKIDLHPNWQTIARLDEQHLHEAGLALPVLPASAVLARCAVERGDDALVRESGLGALLAWLFDEVVTPTAASAARDAAAAVRQVVHELVEQFGNERAALADAADPTARAARLADATATVEAVRVRASRWPQRFGDLFADKVAAIEDDLRERVRTITASCDERLETLEPATEWDEFERWLSAESADMIRAHETFRHDSLVHAVTTLVELVETDQVPSELPASDRAVPVGAPNRPADLRRPRVHAQALTLLRSSYSGVTLFAFVGSMTGVALVGPAMAGLGLLFGARGLRDERARQLAQRRSAARASARRFVDDLGTACRREDRETVRAAQRALRDHFSDVVASQQRQAAQLLESARRSGSTDPEAAKARVADLDAELRRLAALDERARGLLEGSR